MGKTGVGEKPGRLRSAQRAIVENSQGWILPQTSPECSLSETLLGTVGECLTPEAQDMVKVVRWAQGTPRQWLVMSKVSIWEGQRRLSKSLRVKVDKMDWREVDSEFKLSTGFREEKNHLSRQRKRQKNKRQRRTQCFSTELTQGNSEGES